MTNSEITQLIQQAQSTNGRLKISGYTNSNGEQYDYELRVHGSGFYPQLMNDSVTWLEDMLKLEPAALLQQFYGEDPIENMVTVPQIQQVMKAELDKLKTKLAAPFEAAVRTPRDPDVVVLSDVEVLFSTKPPPIKSAASRAVTLDAIITKRLKSQWPLAKYNSQFHLKAGKFEDLQVLPDNART